MRDESVSRTHVLLRAFVEEYTRLHPSDEIIQLKLAEVRPEPFTDEMLQKRTSLVKAADYSDPMFDLARAFVAADKIIIATPYWDFSFPAVLKAFIEHVSVEGLAFKYTETGAVGLCRSNRAIYITTSGSYTGGNNFGYDYTRGLFAGLFGISDTRFISAEGLDIYGNDADAIMADAIKSAENAAKEF